MKTVITFTVKGSKQGLFQGDDEYFGNIPTIHALRFDYEIIAPIDVGSGMRSGKRQHRPITLTHALSASSIQLFNALVNNEHLTEVIIYCAGVMPDGTQYDYYQIKLTNASISRLYQYSEGMELLEDVSFTFQSIEETYLPSNFTAYDGWGIKY